MLSTVSSIGRWILPWKPGQKFSPRVAAPPYREESVQVIRASGWDASRSLAGEVMLAGVTGAKTTRTRRRGYISRLVWEPLGAPLKEDKEVEGDGRLGFPAEAAAPVTQTDGCLRSKLR